MLCYGGSGAMPFVIYHRCAQLTSERYVTTQQQTGKDKFIGAWRLVSYEFRDEEGNVSHPFGEDTLGLIMYDRSGMMSVQIIRHDRPLFPSEDMFGAAPETVKAAFEGINTYYGTFDVDDAEGI